MHEFIRAKRALSLIDEIIYFDHNDFLREKTSDVHKLNQNIRFLSRSLFKQSLQNDVFKFDLRVREKVMSGIHFLASSKRFTMPDEIEDYNNGGIYECGMSFSVYDTDEWWREIVEPVLSMPFIYEVGGIGNYYFFLYLEKYMEVGDVIELFEIPVQHHYEKYIQRVLHEPEAITINVGSYTYQNQYGTYQLNPKTWVEELSHRVLLTERGKTTILKY